MVKWTQDTFIFRRLYSVKAEVNLQELAELVT